jgi:ribose transport system permease protein
VKKTEAIDITKEGLAAAPHRRDWKKQLSFQNISAIYIFVVIFIVFSVIPKSSASFLSGGNWASILDANSLTVMAAIAVMIPLIAGVFNLAIGAEISWAVMICVVLQTPPGQPGGLTLALGLPWQLAAAITIACGALIGLISGLVITKLKIDSFIATLGMSSILAATTYLVSANRPLTNLADPSFHDVYSWGIPMGSFTLTLPIILMVIIAFIVWYVLERTPVGRRAYAAGFNPDGARLSGVNVPALQVGSLVAGGIIAALIGVLAASHVYGSPGYGSSMLLPALSAVFLGSTQFRGGRFNVWGTVLALYVLAVGIQGFLSLGADRWITDLFYGVALIGAVALSRYERSPKRLAAVRRATSLRRAKASGDGPSAGSDADKPKETTKV